MSAYRHIYLSPHLDDVVLSCGGRIHQLGRAEEAVLVVTVFAGSPRFGEEGASLVFSDYIAALHERWETGTDAPALRRAEDQAALQVLGADFCHLSYLDCIYRRHPVTGEFLYQSDEDIFAEVHLGEFSLVVDVREELEGLVGAPGEVTIYAPLAAGHHVDHQIVAAAALALQVTGHRVVFYEDYPYAEVPFALATARQWVGGEKWRQEIFSLSPQDLAAKTGAVLCYRSQLSTFFDDEDQVAQRLRVYARAVQEDHLAGLGRGSHGKATDRYPVSGERVWHLTK